MNLDLRLRIGINKFDHFRIHFRNEDIILDSDMHGVEFNANYINLLVYKVNYSN